MKKYIIKNADGSDQSVMKSVHSSREEAGETLWNYLLDQNEGGALCRCDKDWT